MTAADRLSARGPGQQDLQFALQPFNGRPDEIGSLPCTVLSGRLRDQRACTPRFHQSARSGCGTLGRGCCGGDLVPRARPRPDSCVDGPRTDRGNIGPWPCNATLTAKSLLLHPSKHPGPFKKRCVRRRGARRRRSARRVPTERSHAGTRVSARREPYARRSRRMST